MCPLATPWNVHFVVHMDSEIKHIVWDPTGTRLLTADASGQIFLWQMQESLINKWLYTNFTRSFYGDDVIALKWINTSQMVKLGYYLSLKTMTVIVILFNVKVLWCIGARYPIMKT